MGNLIAKIVITTIDAICSVICFASIAGEDINTKRVGIVFLIIFIANIVLQWV